MRLKVVFNGSVGCKKRLFKQIDYVNSLLKGTVEWDLEFIPDSEVQQKLKELGVSRLPLFYVDNKLIGSRTNFTKWVKNLPASVDKL